jgi:hypothetical protein
MRLPSGAKAQEAVARYLTTLQTAADAADRSAIWSLSHWASHRV